MSHAPPAGESSKGSSSGSGFKATAAAAAAAATRQVSTSPPALDLNHTRVSSACRPCRSRRIKCIPGPGNFSSLDSTQSRPCASCLSSGKGDECVYPQSKDRAAFSRQYVQNLEARVQALELLCNGLNPASSLTRADTEKTNGEEARLRPQRSRAQEETEESKAETGVCVPDEHGYPRWTGVRDVLAVMDSLVSASLADSSVSSHVSGFDHSVLNRLHQSYFGPPGPQDFAIPFLPGVSSLPFPEPDAAEALLEAYLAEVHPLIPFLPPHRIRESVRELMDPRSRYEDLSDFNGLFSLLFAVFALGERVLENKKKRTDVLRIDGWTPNRDDETSSGSNGKRWADIAHYLLSSNSKQINHIPMQCLILLSVYHASVAELPRAWLLAGQAIRYAQDGGSHRDTASPIATFHNKQIRSRGWWTVYGVDRLLSMIIGRNFAVDDEDIDAPFPLVISDNQLQFLDEQEGDSQRSYTMREPADCAFSGFLAMTRLLRIGGRVTRFVQRRRSRSDTGGPVSEGDGSAIAGLESALTEWYEKWIPAKYKAAFFPASQDQSPRSVRIVADALYITYSAVSITLYGYLAINFEHDASFSSWNQKCFDVALQLIEWADRRWADAPPTQYLAVLCQYVWAAGIHLLMHKRTAGRLDLNLGQIAVQVSGGIEACKRVLCFQCNFWPGASGLLHLLEAALEREEEIDQSPGYQGHQKKRKRVDSVDGNDTMDNTARSGISRHRKDGPGGDAQTSRHGHGKTEGNELQTAKLSFFKAFHNRRSAKLAQVASTSQVEDSLLPWPPGLDDNGNNMNALFDLFMNNFN